MKRAVLITLGVVSVILGLLLVAAGGAAAALFGSDGSLSTAPARVSGQGAALVIEDIAIDASSIPVPEGVGTLTLSVSDPQGGRMFVGSASSQAVDTYLTGAPYDVVVEVAAGKDGTTRAVPGTQQPPPPETQSIWTRQASGSPAELTARVGRETTLVVMNADASDGVTADLVVTLTVARAWSAAWIAIGVGIVLVVIALLLFWRARVAGRRARQAAFAAAASAAAPVVPAVASPGATVLPGATAADSPPATASDAPPAAAVAVVEPATTEVPAEPAAPEAAQVLAPPPDATIVMPPVLEPPTTGVAEVPVEASAPPVEPAAVAGAVAAAAATPYADETPEADAVPPTTPEPDAAAGEGVTSVALPADPDAVAARPVDMADLFAPAAPGADPDATAAIPVVPPAYADPAQPSPAADTTGPVAPPGTGTPAG